MANASQLTKINESFVRKQLSKKFGKIFENKDVALKLITGGKHKSKIINLKSDLWRTIT